MTAYKSQSLEKTVEFLTFAFHKVWGGNTSDTLLRSRRLEVVWRWQRTCLITEHHRMRMIRGREMKVKGLSVNGFDNPDQSEAVLGSISRVGSKFLTSLYFIVITLRDTGENTNQVCFLIAIGGQPGLQLPIYTPLYWFPHNIPI